MRTWSNIYDIYDEENVKKWNDLEHHESLKRNLLQSWTHQNFCQSISVYKNKPHLATKTPCNKFLNYQEALAVDWSDARKLDPDTDAEDWWDRIEVNLTRDFGPVDGWGRFTALLPSMRTTNDMVGLRAGSSWTQSNAIWIHLKASLTEQESIIFLSINSFPLPSFHSCQACSGYINFRIRDILYMLMLNW